MKSLKEKVPWMATKEEDLFFDIRKDEVVVHGVSFSPKKFALSRVESEPIFKTVNGDFGTSKPIGIVGPDYVPVKNDILNQSLDFCGFDTKLNRGRSGNHNDKRFSLVYDIEHEPLIDPKTKTEMYPLIVIRNSYDATTGIDISLGLFRALCSNLAIWTFDRRSISMPHIGDDVQQFIADMGKHILELFDDQMFDDVRKKIIGLAKKTTYNIDVSYLSSMPYRNIVSILAVLNHADMKITYDGNTVDNYKLAEEITKRKADRWGLEAPNVERMWQNAESDLQYPEPIASQWELYQFLLKLYQVNRKNNYAKFAAGMEIARLFK